MKKILKGLNKIFCALLESHDQISQYKLRSELIKQTHLLTTAPGISDSKICDKEVVVSLTTYGKRLYEVYLTIESIMQGTLKPNRIVLWLQEDMKSQYLPLSLKKQMDRGLEIFYTKDIRSFKKLIPSLKKYGDSVIITIDDDVLYEYDVIEKLVNAYKDNPNHVYGNRLKRFSLDKNGLPIDYRKWCDVQNGDNPSPRNMCIGVGGVLYPPHCFPEEVFNESVFMRLCPRADDIWFWCMANMNGFSSSKVYTHNSNGVDFLINPDVQDIALTRTNLAGRSENNMQLRSLIDYYNCDFYKGQE